MHPAASLIWIGYTEGWVDYRLLCAFLLRTFWYVLPPNYRSNPLDEKVNSALLLSRRTYPPRDSWNFFGLRWGKSTKARQIDRLLSRPLLRKSKKKNEMIVFFNQRPLLGMQILRVLSLPTSRHHPAGSCRYQQREKKTTKWKQQLTMALGPDNVLGVGGIGARGKAVTDVFIPGPQ